MKRLLRRIRDIVRNAHLVRKYPFLRMRDYRGRKLSVSLTWYDCIPVGWRKAFGIRLCDDIVKAYVEETGSRKGMFENIVICEVKEKYGELRIYASAPEKVQDVLLDYEKKSWDYCIECGKRADYQSVGWIMPLCEEHKMPNSIRKDECK